MYSQTIEFSRLTGISRGHTAKHLRGASVAYRVADRPVKVSVIGRESEYFDKKVATIFTKYLDQLFNRVDLVEPNGECIILLGNLHHTISSFEYQGNKFQVRAHRFKRTYSSTPLTADEIYENVIFEKDGNRTVFTRLPEINGEYRIGRVHKDIMGAITNHETITWGNIVTIPVSNELRAIAIFGAHGTGKTEGSTNMVDFSRALLVDDDAALIRRRGFIGGTGYKCIFSFKEPFKFESYDPRKDPEKNHLHAKQFLDPIYPPRHLPISKLPELAIGRKVESLSDICTAESSRVETMLFQLPNTYYTNMWFKDENLESIKMAFAELEGTTTKKEYHKYDPVQARADILQHFVETSPIDLGNQKSISNLKETYSDDELTTIFGMWMREQSKEYSTSDYHMRTKFSEMIRTAQNIFMVGKRTPPRGAQGLANLVAEITVS